MKLQFNNQKFVEQAKAIYGNGIITECTKLNSKEIVKKSVANFKENQATFEYNHKEIENALNKICENEVGDLMIKLYHINRDKGENLSPLRIWNNEHKFEPINRKYFSLDIKKLPDTDKQRNFFSREDFTIYLAPSHVSDIKLSRYDGRNVSYDCTETLDTVLFHELLHAFHCLIKRNQSGGTSALDYFYSDSELKGIWGKFERQLTDKELSDITGWYYDKEQQKVRFDPINCNMYEICKWSKTLTPRKDFRQRIAHKDQDDLHRFCQEKNIKLNDVLYKIDEIILNLDEWLLDVSENGYTERVR